MTIKETLKKINELPGIRALYVPEFKEFQVLVVGKPDATYYTEDREDALSTAHKMSEYFDRP